MGVLKLFSKPVVFIFLGLITFHVIIDSGTSFENEQLLYVLNILFTGFIPIVVSVFAAHSYLQNGIPAVLLMSCGMFVFGLGSLLSTYMQELTGSTNISIGIYNLSVFAGAVSNILAAFIEQKPDYKPAGLRQKKINLALIFSGISILVAVIVFFAETGFLPNIIDSHGFTEFRNRTHWVAVVLYFGAFMAFSKQYHRSKMDYLYWYAQSLLMIALGLFAVYLSRNFDSALSWTGRTSQYAGGLFALISLWNVYLSAQTKGVTISTIMADFFSDGEAGYKSVINSSPNAILCINSEFRIFFVNSAVVSLFGCNENKMMNQSFLDFLPDHYKNVIQNDFEKYKAHGVSTLIGQTSDMVAVHKSGRSFPVEISISARKLQFDSAYTLIVRDTTKRKHNQELISRQHKILKAINQVYENSIRFDTVEDLAEACLFIAEKVTGSKTGFIGQLKEDGQLYDLAAGHLGYQQDIKGKHEHFGQFGDFNINGIYSMVLAEGKTFLTNSPLLYCKNIGMPQDHPPLTSFLGVPFKRNGKVLGMIVVENREGGYTDNEKTILEALAPTILEVILHKRSEQMLRDSKERFNAFMNASPFSARIKDDQGHYVYANQTCLKVFGKSWEEVKGKNCYDFFPKSDADRLTLYHMHVVGTGKPVENIDLIPDQDGKIRYWKSIRFPFKNTSGQIFSGLIAMDITEQKETEEALKRGASLLQAIIEGTNGPVYLKDRENRILIANYAACVAIGATVHNILGRRDIEIYEDKQAAQVIMETDNRIMAQDSAETVEEIVPSPEGPRTYLSAKTPWHNQDGEVIGVIGISQDITDRKSMVLKLQKQTKELEQKNRLITDFFINISHEFKTPLSILMLGIDLLEYSMDGNNESSEIPKYIEIMKQNSYRLARLVFNLLDITKLDAGFMEPKWERMDIVGLLSNLVETTGYYVKQKSLELRFTHPDDGIVMFTDSFFLERIVLNILSNAIKHTQPGGHIDVNCRILDGRTVISIKDNGEGIPEEKKEIIFDRFRQVDTSLSRTSEGCGIGLALSKSLAELLQGKIKFESTLGEGSEFVIELPILQMEENDLSFDQNGMQLKKRIQLEFSDIDFN